MRIPARIVDALIARSKLTPYFDLYDMGGDRSLYMGRNWLMPRCLLGPDPENEGGLKALPWLPMSVRLHHIARPDLDRDMHDHPATFVSIVLRGGYLEARPTSQTPNWRGDEEDCVTRWRLVGAIGIRRFTDRHRIVEVLPDTVTLVLWFRKRQSWGFFTRGGKVHWKDYDSVHNAEARPPA